MPYTGIHKVTAKMLGLEDLPIEVIEIIAHELDGNSLCALRLTSKRYENACFKALVARIQSMRFALAPWSLPTLRDIARHTTIAKKIETVRLSRSLLDSYRWAQEADRQIRIAEDTNEGDEEGEPLDERLERDERTFLEYCEPQESFIKQEAEAMLIEILNLLPNLRNVAFGEWEVPTGDMYNDHFNYFEKDFHAHQQIHGFPSAQADKYEDAYMPKDDGWTEITVVLRALADSKKPIEGFFVRSFSLYDHYINLQHMVRLNPLLKQGLSTAFEHLRSLHLSIEDGINMAFGNPDNYPEDEVNEEEGIRWLADLLDLAPHVEDLTLSFYECEQAEEVFHEVVSRDSLARLKHFELHFIYLPASDLAKFLATHASSLQAVTLRHCGLTDSRWSKFIRNTLQFIRGLHASITLARLCETDHFELQSNWCGSVIFDIDKLADCCSLSSDWTSIQGLDCKHLNRTVQRHDLADLKMNIVDRSDAKYRERELKKDQAFEAFMQEQVENGRSTQERVDESLREIREARRREHELYPST